MTTPTTRPRNRKATWQGSKWIRPERRLALYLRDGLACAYCGCGIEGGAQLSLDHLKPYSRGGGNESANLVTACTRCNSARGNRSVAAFARAVAEYLNEPDSASEIVARVRRFARRLPDVAGAREILTRRGTLTAAIRSAAKSR